MKTCVELGGLVRACPFSQHEWLDQYIIESIEEAQDQATQWLWTYNNDRPNRGIGGITPAMKPRMAA
ncbi:transposase InsO family protein [Rhodobaca bogoriensis DSM 18756]|nr:transposase InsO family protein [Rhodobaca bogoriensis DSM 18756]